MSDKESHEPPLHYGYSPERSGYTACGEVKTYVRITWFPAKVTCPVCIEEVRAMEFVDDKTGEALTGDRVLKACPRDTAEAVSGR